MSIVNIADTLMASSGSTRKITVNQLLGAGGTATLASATITGDLTVATSSLKVTGGNVSVGTATPTSIAGYTSLTINTATTGSFLDLNVAGVNKARFLGTSSNLTIETSGTIPVTFLIGGQNQYKIDTAGVFTWYDGAGGTRMILNSTGLGVGVSPSYRLDATDNTTNIQLRLSSSNNNGTSLRFVNTGTSGRSWQIGTGFAVTAGNFEIYDVTAAANRLSIDSSGNVGIGVTPSAWGAAFKPVQLTYGSLYSQAFTVAGVAANCYNAGAGGWTYFGSGQTASRYEQSSGTHAWYTAVAGSGAITFTQAMTLDASGRLLVNTTSVIGGSGDTLQIAGKTTASTDYCSMYTGTSTTVYGSRYYHTSAVVGSITFTASGTAYNIASDYRLKESVQPLTGGLARINALKPSIYKWKVNNSNGEGFIAHELADVVPAAVTGEKDAVNEDGSIKPQQVDLSKIVPILVAAIKELAAEVNALKNA